MVTKRSRTSFDHRADWLGQDAFLAELFLENAGPKLIICDDLYRAQQLADDLENLLDPADVLLFPVEEMLASEMATSSPEFKAQRVLALEAFSQAGKKS